MSCKKEIINPKPKNLNTVFYSKSYTLLLLNLEKYTKISPPSEIIWKKKQKQITFYSQT